MTELEMLAVVWATKKCRVYLQGLQHYEVLTDHKPLIPILNNKSLADMENPRLLRLKEKLLGYSFKAIWVRGKDHVVPDALSRSPVSQPTEDDVAMEIELCSISVNGVLMA